MVTEEPGAMSSLLMTSSSRNNITDHDHRCLCNQFHIVTGAKVIGTLELVSIGFFLLIMLINISIGRQRIFDAVSIVWLTILLISAFIVMLLFLAILAQKALLVLPHLVCQAIFLMGLLIHITMSTIATFLLGFVTATSFDETETKYGSIGIAYMIVLIVLEILVVTFETWWFFVIVRLFQFLKMKPEETLMINAKILYNNSTDELTERDTI